MSISLRNDIYTELITTLKTISIANGYNTDLNQQVSEDLQNIEQVHELPYLYLIDGSEDKDWVDVDGLECALTFICIGYVREDANDASAGTLIRKLLADVEKCVCADSRRNGKAIRTLVTNIKTDEGNLKPEGVFNCDIQVIYRQKYGDPTVNG